MSFLNNLLVSLGIKKSSQDPKDQKADIEKDFVTSPSKTAKKSSSAQAAPKVTPKNLAKDSVEKAPKEPVKKETQTTSQPQKPPAKKNQKDKDNPATSIEELEKRMKSGTKIKFQEGGPEEREEKQK